jgi:deoxyadenosine kinase
MRIAVSGNIGAGKSTFCGRLSKDMNFPVFEEPVVDNPYLEDFYKDPEKWAFNAQMFMISHRFHRQVESMKDEGITGAIMDRCFHEDLVFAEVNHDLGNISERDWATYRSVYLAFCKVVSPPEVVVYLRTSPGVALGRIKSRAREQEMGIGLEYMESLHRSYEKWTAFMKGISRVIEVDWDDLDDSKYREVVLKVKNPDFLNL